MIYFIRENRAGLIKIVMEKNGRVESLLRTMQKGAAGDLTLIGSCPGREQAFEQITARLSEHEAGHGWYLPSVEVLDLIPKRC